MANTEEGLTKREGDRLEVIREVVGTRLVQREAGERMRLNASISSIGGSLPCRASRLEVYNLLIYWGKS